MSHEIRTPLNAVLGFTELLRHEASTITETDREEYLDTINTSGQHLLQLINDILDLSRVEAGYLDVELRECSPLSLLEEVVALLSVRAKERGLEVNYHWIGPRPESIETDEYRLRQLLMNLVGNAIKFTSTGRVDILAELERVETSEAGNASSDDEFFLRVAVIDTGIGIDSDRVGHIFEPFSQADTSITRRYGGTGLGLAISQRVAAALGGRLEVRSTKDVGSTFTARVAARNIVWQDESEEILEAVEQDQVGIEMRFDGLPSKVLIVDDGETNRKLVRLMLEKHGVETANASDGREGVDAILKGDFDLVLMDMQMPVMDGYSATRELRSKGLALPIIALTAHAMKGDEDKCLEAGCSGYLTKPVDSVLLLNLVSNELRAPSQQPNESLEITPFESTLSNAEVHSSLPTDDPEFREIVIEFVERLQVKLVEMRSFQSNHAFQRVSQMAHWLKGAGGTAGFAQFTEPAGMLEAAALQNDSAACGTHMSRLEEIASRIVVPEASNC